MKKFKKKMSKKNLIKVLVSVVICLAVILSGMYVLFIPEFVVPYSEDLMTTKIPVDGGIDVLVNLPNYTQVYSMATSSESDGEFDIYLTVTRNLWSMIAPDFDEMNNFWRTNGFIGVSFQASDDMPFKESDVNYFRTDRKIANIYYADFESTHSTNPKADLRHAIYSETAKTYLIWSATESE